MEELAPLPEEERQLAEGLLAGGGFLYFKAQKARPKKRRGAATGGEVAASGDLVLCGAAALGRRAADESALVFGAPLMLRELDAQRWSRAVMEARAGREALQPITFETLRQMGVHHFSWLPPQPELHDAADAGSAPAPLGGFAYLYSAEHAHFDCIIPLVEPCARGSDYVPVARLQSSSSADSGRAVSSSGAG